MVCCLPIKKSILLFIIFMLLKVQMTFAGASDPPDFQPQLTIQYFDSQMNKTVTLKNCRPGMTYQVPGGAMLTLIIDVLNIGDNPSSDPVSTDIWHDWPYRKRPKDTEDADAVCVPENPGDCRQIINKLKADDSYKGRKGKGVYHIVVWTDRFDTQTEADEDNNYLGPIKIVTLPTVKLRKRPLTIKPPTLKKGFERKKREGLHLEYEVLKK